MAFTAASVPVFLSAPASATLGQKIEDSDRYSAGISVMQSGELSGPPVEPPAADSGLDTSPQAPPLWEQRGALLQDAVSDMGLGEQVVTLLGPEAEVTVGNSTAEPVRLLSRTGFEDHVDVIARDGEGADREHDGRRAGRRTRRHRRGGGRRPLRRGRGGGIYRSLVERPFPRPYWIGLSAQIYPGAAGFAAPLRS